MQVTKKPMPGSQNRHPSQNKLLYIHKETGQEVPAEILNARHINRDDYIRMPKEMADEVGFDFSLYDPEVVAAEALRAEDVADYVLPTAQDLFVYWREHQDKLGWCGNPNSLGVGEYRSRIRNAIHQYNRKHRNSMDLLAWVPDDFEEWNRQQLRVFCFLNKINIPANLVNTTLLDQFRSYIVEEVMRMGGIDIDTRQDSRTVAETAEYKAWFGQLKGMAKESEVKE